MEAYLDLYGFPSPIAVADFVAGLMFGLTGDNHLTEIEQCFKSTDPMRVDLMAAIEDFKSFDFIAGIEDIGDIIWQIPVAFQDCTGMEDDIAAIEAWAEIFKQPIALAQTVALNWLKHGVEIETDISKTEADWEAEQYFDSGKDAANAMVALLGPINPAELALY